LYTRKIPLFWPEITKTRFSLSGELINVTLIIIQFGESFRCVRIIANISFVTCGRTDGRLPLDGFPWNLVLGTFMKVYRENPNLVETGQKYRTLHMTTSVRSVVAGDFKWKYKRSLRVKLYQAVRIAEVQILGESATMLRCTHTACLVVCNFHRYTFRVR
jgi:hypothetical protein